MTVASADLVRAQVGAVLQKAPHADVIALSADPEWDGPDTLTIDGTAARIVACRSPLAIHSALRDHDVTRVASSGTAGGAVSNDVPRPGPLVILTNLDDDAVGADIRVRIVKHRVIPLNRWQAVLAAFSATRLDPRLIERQELADALIAMAPAGGYAPSASGFLDRDSAARALVAVLFGTAVPDGTLTALLTALTDIITVGRLTAAPPAAVDEAFRWLRARLGPPVEMIWAAVSAGRASEVPALALVCGVVWSQRAIAAHPSDATAAAVRLEPSVGQAVDPVAAQALADAAANLTTSGSASFDAVAKDAEALLVSVRAEQLVWTSPALPAGFEMRLARLGVAITRVLDSPHPAPDTLAEVASCAADVADHRMAAAHLGRVAGVKMAARLCRRLAAVGGATDDVDDFAGAAERYATEGSFADWALDVLSAGEDSPGVADAYRRLMARTEETRRSDDRRFGKLLARWAPTGASGGQLLMLEDVLPRVVTPLVESGAKVLVVVMDGMSMRVYHELLVDLLSTVWAERGRSPSGDRLVGVAAFPTVTKVSRTSLLSGSLQVGDSSTEKDGFAAALGASSKMWHKADLHAVDGLSLPTEVSESLSVIRGPAAVGVVVNTVDDHLLKGDQIGVRWGVASLGPLAAVLRAAVGRTVVLTADHGHVNDGSKARVADGGGERWRPATGPPPVDDEVTLTGRRVLLGDGAVVVPWTKSVRYSAGARHGYHGGASPAEVIVPVAVLVSDDQDLEGWVDVPASRPGWWDEVQIEPIPEIPPSAEPPAAGGRRRRSAPSTPAPSPQLFEPPVPLPEPPAADDWIAALQAGDTYRAQVGAAGRRAPADTWVRKALTALVSRAGTLPLAAFALATGSSTLRARGQVSGLSALLNVDGYLVVRIDEMAPGGTVILDRALLAAQFGVVIP
jgi:hypothetical protein